MMRFTRATLALGLVLASGAAQADTQVRNASPNGAPGSLTTVKGYLTPDSKEAPAAATYNIPVAINSHSGTIAAADTSQVAVVANLARRAGYCQADPRNTDILVIAFGIAASTTMGAPSACIVRKGGTCPMTVGGAVFQGAVNVTSPTVGQGFNCPDFQ